MSATGSGPSADTSAPIGPCASSTHRCGSRTTKEACGTVGARPLTGSLACYRIYECADGRYLTVAALEPKFWRRLCEVLGRPDLLSRAADAHTDLEEIFRGHSLDEWLRLFEDEDVCAGPVATLEEAAPEFGSPKTDAKPPSLGEHTDAWRTELDL